MVDVKINTGPRVLTAEEQVVADKESATAYKFARQSEMPEVADVLDAICKYIETGDRSEFDGLQVIRNAAKTKHKKP